MALPIPNVSFKATMVFHTILLIFIGYNMYLSASYFFSNYLLVLLGFWAIAQPLSTDAVQMYFGFHLFTIVNDLACLANFTKYLSQQQSEFKFAFAMALISLLFKPLTAIFVMNEFTRRGGVLEFSIIERRGEEAGMLRDEHGVPTGGASDTYTSIPNAEAGSYQAPAVPPAQY